MPEIGGLRIDQYEAIIELWVQAGLEYKPKGRDTREHMRQEMQDNPDMFLGLFEEDRMIGTVVGTYDGRRGWINRLGIHPEFRGRGLGKLLINEIEGRLRARGARIIAVLVYEDNEPSLEVFKRSGYRVFEGVKYLTKRDGPEV